MGTTPIALNNNHRHHRVAVGAEKWHFINIRAAYTSHSLPPPARAPSAASPRVRLPCELTNSIELHRSPAHEETWKVRLPEHTLLLCSNRLDSTRLYSTRLEVEMQSEVQPHLTRRVAELGGASGVAWSRVAPYPS